MLDIRDIRENADKLKNTIRRRNMEKSLLRALGDDVPRTDENVVNATDPDNNDSVDPVDRFLADDAKWLETLSIVESLRKERNDLSKEIPKAEASRRAELIAKVKTLKETLTTKESVLATVSESRKRQWQRLPNWLAEDVPEGHTDEENLEISRIGTPPDVDFEMRDHVELGKITDTIDFDTATKVSGSNFYFLKGGGAVLSHALEAYAMGKLIAAGFTPMITPDIAKESMLEGIGFSPRGEEKQVYHLDEDGLCLIGTAEITLGAYHAGETLLNTQLPLRYAGLSHCFRTESGAYGRESRGLYRVHQFSKVEMFVICTPDQSHTIHEEIRTIEESILKDLNIPYRVVNVCAGDLGAPAYKKYDIEAWMPGRKKYGEVTSCSNCTDYQSRRLNVKYKLKGTSGNEQTAHVHMLNGTAVAVSRTLLAIYENYQQTDGSILIPDCLKPYCHNMDLIPTHTL